MAEKENRPRAGHKEGSVYYVEERDRWVAEITLQTGKRKKAYCKTKQEAQRKKNEMLRELERGTLATGPQRKLGEYIQDWLENTHKSKLRLSVYLNYRKHVKHIVAGLGDIWLQKLTPQQVQSFLSQKLNEGLSPKYVREMLGVLSLALNNAVKWGYLSRNVCELVTRPRVPKHEIAPLTLEQARRFRQHIQGHRYEVLITMAVVTGMRRGELLSLRWSDIDFQRNILQVLHTVDRFAGHGYVEGEPKSAAGVRSIRLPGFLVDMLKQHRAEQMERKSKSKTWQERDLVFPNLRGGYTHPNRLGEAFRALLEEAGLPAIRFHDLRHSAATILLSMGVNIKVIQEMLGHSDISITLRVYGHLLPSMQQEAVDKWEGAFEKQQEGKQDEAGG
ncbi:MAG TPA: tyrosine-type recombinase/integrase [Ktedonobacteraceae bacterium]|nr:tyrosine-type recombinase/integrase [Ktedonobacteraceae bacterium]